MLGRLDHVRAQPLQLRLLDDRSAGQHRDQPRRAQLAGLFGQPVDPPLLQRRGAKPQIRHDLARSHQPLDLERDGTLAGLDDARFPLAGQVVEQQHRRTFSEPQHARQVMRLRALQLDQCSGAEAGFHEQARRPPARDMLVFAHGPFPRVLGVSLGRNDAGGFICK